MNYIHSCLRMWFQIFMLQAILIFSNFACADSIVPYYKLLKTNSNSEIYFFKSPKIPIFQIEMVLPQGCSQDPMNRSGVSQFLATMLSKGISSLNEDQIHEKLDFMAASIGVSVENDKTIISASALNDKIEPVLDIFFKMLTESTIPQDVFARLKSNHLDRFKKVDDSASQMLDRALHFVLFNGTKWARPCSGMRSDFQKISLKDVVKQKDNLLFQMLFNSKIKVLIIGGNDQKEIVDRFLKKLNEFEKNLALIKQSEKQIILKRKEWQLDPNHILVLNRAGISEAYLGISALGPTREIPEYYDLLVASQILGGSFKSRLNQVLREKLGLTYSVQGGYSMDHEVGQFSVLTAARAENSAEVILEIEKILQDFSKAEFSESEIKLAKDYLAGSFPLGLSNIYSIASTFFQGLINGYSADFLDVYEKNIQKVTENSLKKAIQKYFKLEVLKTIIVGDAQKIEKSLNENQKIKSSRKLVHQNFESFL